MTPAERDPFEHQAHEEMKKYKIQLGASETKRAADEKAANRSSIKLKESPEFREKMDFAFNLCRRQALVSQQSNGSKATMATKTTTEEETTRNPTQASKIKIWM